MSSLVFSIPTAATTSSASTANASSAASSSGRGRETQAPTDAEGFGAALARSRQPEDKAQPESSAAPTTTRRRALASDPKREEASPAELLAMAMLTPTFSTQAVQQQGRAAGAQGGELAARTPVDAAATAATGEPLAAADTPAAEADARTTAQSSTATAQAAGMQAADEQDADTKNTTQAKAETPTAASDAKAPVAVLPSVATPAQGTAAAAAPAASAASGATTALAGSAAKTTADAAALSLQASEAAPADHPLDTATDTPALPPGMLNFKTALAEATNVQTATAAQAQAVPRLHVPTPVGSEGWGADIGTQMIRMGTDGHHVAELSLNPAGLGPLKVTLTLGDNQAQAMFVSAHESVRRAVEAALPQLRDTLAGQGIQLGQASVDAGTPQQQQAFGQERGFEPSARGAPRGAQQAAASEAEPARTASRSRASSGIDTFA